jgi:hypothetical protein
VDPSQPVCRHCRHTFEIDYRNRGRSEHLQQYCGKPMCRAASDRESKARYRALNPEDNDQVAARMRRWRQSRQRRSADIESDVPSGAPEQRQPLKDGKSHAVPRSTRTDANQEAIDVLAQRLSQLSGQMAALIVADPCVTGVLKSSQIGIQRGDP